MGVAIIKEDKVGTLSSFCRLNSIRKKGGLKKQLLKTKDLIGDICRSLKGA